jgi:hypothetical protein
VSDTSLISDGYHTFGELYEHRLAIFLALMVSLQDLSWCSLEHHPADGPMFDDCFICGICLPTGDVTYHYNLRFWKLVSGRVKVVEHAPKWDGHTPADVIQRLKLYATIKSHTKALE